MFHLTYEVIDDVDCKIYDFTISNGETEISFVDDLFSIKNEDVLTFKTSTACGPDASTEIRFIVDSTNVEVIIGYDCNYFKSILPLNKEQNLSLRRCFLEADQMVKSDK